jgi:hypothetical protein
MSAPFVIPFNFCPTSVSVKTASYTIPAGRYAQVYVEADSGGIFTIDAVSAVVTAAFVNIDQIVTGAGVLTYTAPTGYRSNITALGSNSNDTVSINGNSGTFTLVANTMRETSFELGPAGNLSLTPAGTRTAGISGSAIPSNNTSRQATFWVPTGTVISGSGNWKAVVQEYNVIS